MRGLIVILVLASSAFAGTIDDAIGDARYREYGETFAPYTHRIVGMQVDGSPAVATCTAIAPDWALTAAHVVEDMTSCHVVTGSGTHRVAQVFAHAGYDGRFQWHDIALVRLAQPFTLAKYPPLTDGTERLGGIAVAVGYGVTGPIATGWRNGDLEIRAGTQRLDALEGTVFRCEINRDTVLPFAIGPGDSGGPLFSIDAKGRTVLVGVNSYTSRRGSGVPRSMVGEESGHTRVALYREWIKSIAGVE
jgi:S1-C subfamily serine protease